MNKKIIKLGLLSIALITAPFISAAQPEKPTVFTSATWTNPEKVSDVLFVDDLHNVAVKKDKWQVYKNRALATPIFIGDFALLAVEGIIYGATLGNVKMGMLKSALEIKEFMKTSKEKSGEPFINIFKKNNCNITAWIVAKLSSCYKPNPVYDNLLTVRKNAGADSYMASNIGPSLYKTIFDDFNKRKSPLFTYLNKGIMPSYSSINFGGTFPDLTPGIPTGIDLSNYNKPQDGFYNDLAKKVNTSGEKKPIVFTDDSVRNLKAFIKWANENNYPGAAILYHASKNSENDLYGRYRQLGLNF